MTPVEHYQRRISDTLGTDKPAMVKQHGQATWSSNMVKQHGQATWSSNMVKQHGQATWSSNMVKHNHVQEQQ
jgi:hypothetical protein